MSKKFNVNHLIAFLDEKIPFDWSEEWDNSGLQIGFRGEQVSGILISLNPTPGAIEYCLQKGYNVLLTHHPLFFTPIRSIDTEVWPGELIYKAINNGISIIALHTNFDKSPSGISVNLAKRLGLPIEGPLVPDGEWGLGVLGKFDYPVTLSEVAENIHRSFSLPVRVIDPSVSVSNYALCGGSCSSLSPEVKKKNIQLFITSDVKYHEMIDNYFAGVNIISVDHSVEKWGFFPLKNMLEGWLKEIEVNIEIETYEEDITIKWINF